MKRIFLKMLDTYRQGLSILSRYSIIYGFIAFVYTTSLIDFGTNLMQGKVGIVEWLVMIVATLFVISVVTFRLWVRCKHQRLSRIRVFHGDAINHVDARSLWKCHDCGREVYSESLNEYKHR